MTALLHPARVAARTSGHPAYVMTATGTIDFMEDLPRHPTGKLYKGPLRDRCWWPAPVEGH
jgi:hypothetical protein